MNNKEQDKILFYCFGPSTCLSTKYVHRVFHNLGERLAENIAFDCAIADFNVGSPERAKWMNDLCSENGYTKLILGGWCNGGLEALRIAQNIDVKTLETSCVALFDTYESLYWNSYSGVNEISIKESLTLFYQQMTGDDDFDLYNALDNFKLEEMPDFVIDKIAGKDFSKQTVQRMLSKYNAVRKEIIAKKGNISLGDYSYKGKILLFTAMDEITTGMDPYLGWHKCMDLEFIGLNANHFSMFSMECVDIIAAKLYEYL